MFDFIVVDRLISRGSAFNNIQNLPNRSTDFKKRLLVGFVIRANCVFLTLKYFIWSQFLNMVKNVDFSVLQN